MFFGAHIAFQKPVAIFLLVITVTSLIFSNLLIPTQTVKAQWAVFDAAESIWDAMYYAYEQAADYIKEAYAALSSAAEVWLQQDGILMKALRFAWDVLRKQLMAMLVNDIVKWIQGGGVPRGVTDWQQFLKDAANAAAGTFIDQYLGMGFLCQRFDVKLKIALTAIPTFDESVKCTFSQIVANINTFLNDFSQGGWKAWISISEAPNNIMGAYLIALDKKIGVQAEAEQAAQNEAIASSGFLEKKDVLNSTALISVVILYQQMRLPTSIQRNALNGKSSPPANLWLKQRLKVPTWILTG